MANDPRDSKERTASAVEAGRRSFIAYAAYDARRAQAPAPAPAPVPPPPQKIAEKPAPEPAIGAKPAEPAKDAKPPEQDMTTIPAPYAPPAEKPAQWERTTLPVPWCLPPDTEANAQRGEDARSTIVPAEPPPQPQGFVPAAVNPDIVSAIFEMEDRERRESLIGAASHGISQAAIELGTSPMRTEELREYSMVEANLANIQHSAPERFRPILGRAMEILRKSLEGFEPAVEKFIRERRWTREEEEGLRGAFVKASDEIQKIFNQQYVRESESRLDMWREHETKLADTEQKFAFTIISSKDSKSNHETNIFDAFAKGTIFLYLIQQRPGSFIHAISHPEISKPYASAQTRQTWQTYGLGGAEGLGVSTGLLLYPQNLQFAYLFRCYSETHVVTVAHELRDAILKRSERPTVAKFEDMVRQDVLEFETAVSSSGFGAERFFGLLNDAKSGGPLRENDELKAIFAKAEKEGLIYTKADDIFDALELLIEYMSALQMNPNARDRFLEFYFANYPLGEKTGTFYKMFGMCLFATTDDIELHRIAKKAFRKDRNPLVRACFEKRIGSLQFEERETLVGISAKDAAAAAEGPKNDETDFGDLNGL